MSTVTTGISYQSPALQIPPNGWNLNGYYFDAWLRLQHQSDMTITRHPVETGAEISDHCYAEPRRWIFQIGMSDVSTSPVAEQFSANPTRSVNAYNTLYQLQQSRTLLSLTSKYGTYTNVLIQSMIAIDDWRTKNALKVNVTLQEIILVSTSVVPVSAHQQTTDQTNRGQVAPFKIPSTIPEAQKALALDWYNVMQP